MTYSTAALYGLGLNRFNTDELNRYGHRALRKAIRGGMDFHGTITAKAMEKAKKRLRVNNQARKLQGLKALRGNGVLSFIAKMGKAVGKLAYKIGKHFIKKKREESNGPTMVLEENVIRDSAPATENGTLKQRKKQTGGYINPLPNFPWMEHYKKKNKYGITKTII